jgi:two-component system, sensor histidine kinase and response regulator
MDDYLAKPYTMFQLGNVLSRWNGNAAREPEAADEPLQQGDSSEHSSKTDAGCCIDPSYLQNIWALQESSGTKLVETVITTYLNDAPRILRSLREALAAGDPNSLRQHAHYFKSSSAALGATRLCELCKELEIVGKEGHVKGAETLLLYAEQEFQRLLIS